MLASSPQRCCTSGGHAWSAGGYELEEHAAEAYDVAALKCKGPGAKVNFDLQQCAAHALCCCIAVMVHAAQADWLRD